MKIDNVTRLPNNYPDEHISSSFTDGEAEAVRGINPEHNIDKIAALSEFLYRVVRMDIGIFRSIFPTDIDNIRHSTFRGFIDPWIDRVLMDQEEALIDLWFGLIENRLPIKGMVYDRLTMPKYWIGD